MEYQDFSSKLNYQLSELHNTLFTILSIFFLLGHNQFYLWYFYIKQLLSIDINILFLKQYLKVTKSWKNILTGGFFCHYSTLKH